jgi:hypothetical protein
MTISRELAHAKAQLLVDVAKEVRKTIGSRSCQG